MLPQFTQTMHIADQRNYTIRCSCTRPLPYWYLQPSPS